MLRSVGLGGFFIEELTALYRGVRAAAVAQPRLINRANGGDRRGSREYSVARYTWGLGLLEVEQRKTLFVCLLRVRQQGVDTARAGGA